MTGHAQTADPGCRICGEIDRDRLQQLIHEAFLRGMDELSAGMHGRTECAQ